MFKHVPPCEDRSQPHKQQPLSDVTRALVTRHSNIATSIAQQPLDHAYRKLEVKMLYMSTLRLPSHILNGSRVVEIYRFSCFGLYLWPHDILMTTHRLERLRTLSPIVTLIIRQLIIFWQALGAPLHRFTRICYHTSNSLTLSSPPPHHLAPPHRITPRAMFQTLSPPSLHSPKVAALTADLSDVAIMTNQRHLLDVLVLVRQTTPIPKV